VLAFAALATQFKQTITILDGAFLLDGFAIVLDVVVLGAAALSLLASQADVLPGDLEQPVVPAFYLMATLGAMLAISAAEIISLFVSLEVLAVSLYVLAALVRRGPGSMTVSVGFAVTGIAASGIVLYGLALLFGLTGHTQLHAAGTALAALKPNQPAVLLTLSLLIVGFGFRMGVAPIRWWIRGFEIGVALRVLVVIYSVGVVAGFAVFGRILTSSFAGTRIGYAPILAIVAAVTMTAGTLLAITQNSLRRMVVYSAIGQAGFGLAAFTDLSRLGLPALTVFLVALALTTTCAYAAVIAYARSVHTDVIRDLAGISAPMPALALALTLAFLSMAGIPPLAGFFGKLLILQATIDGGYAWLAVIGAVNILIAAFGYLRVIKAAFVDPPIYEVVPARLDTGIRAGLALACIGVVFMGLLLGPLYSAATYGRNALLH
jgi:NADH-quinone oxidoreductase subunit N